MASPTAAYKYLQGSETYRPTLSQENIELHNARPQHPALNRAVSEAIKMEKDQRERRRGNRVSKKSSQHPSKTTAIPDSSYPSVEHQGDLSPMEQFLIIDLGTDPVQLYAKTAAKQIGVQYASHTGKDVRLAKAIAIDEHMAVRETLSVVVQCAEEQEDGE